jgi:hypothetical protein
MSPNCRRAKVIGVRRNYSHLKPKCHRTLKAKKGVTKVCHNFGNGPPFGARDRLAINPES